MAGATFSEMNEDSDDDFCRDFAEALVQYKEKKRKENVTPQPTMNSQGLKATFKKDLDENGSPNKGIDSSEKVKCQKEVKKHLHSSSDIVDLVQYFMLPRKNQAKELEKKSYRDYEKQGAIPKRKFENDFQEIRSTTECNGLSLFDIKKDLQPRDFFFNENKTVKKFKKKNSTALRNASTLFSLNHSKRIVAFLNQEICSKPFFYIVPEKPSPDVLFPRGSYYIVPKTPDPSCGETIVLHPESSIAFTAQPEITQKTIPNHLGAAQKQIHDSADQFEQSFPQRMNNLGKDVPQAVDSHLNIGPTQLRERYCIDNLESACTSKELHDKFFTCLEKPLINSEFTPETNETSQITSGVPEKKFNSDDITRKVLAVQGTLMRELPQLSEASAASVAENYFLDEEGLEEYIRAQRLDYKIQEQFNRMVEALPEARLSVLLEVCTEFQGDEGKVTAYIEEAKRKNELEQLVTDLQAIFPDADPNFLHEKIGKLGGNAGAVNILTDELLEEQNYPKIATTIQAEKKKLWQTYVVNFSVENYLVNVPKPADFAGAAGDYNKADPDLIKEFLKTRYPTADVTDLYQKFITHNRNLTKTCSSITQFEAVRLSRSKFEQRILDEDFLKEICYIDHMEEIDNHLKAVQEMKEIEAMAARWEGSFLCCPLCSDEELIASEVVTCPEGHVFCRDCIIRYVEIKLSDGIYKFACSDENCDAFFTIQTLGRLLPEKVVSVIVHKQQTEEISTAKVDGLEFCPQCDFAYIPNPQDSVFKCLNPQCLTEICRKCHEKSHIPLRCEEVERPKDVEARKRVEEAMTEKLVRKCMKCNKAYVKIDGCNKIQCTCGAIMCYICREEVRGYDHFSNSGRGGLCPLYSNNDVLHKTEVMEAGVRTREDILEEDPDVRFFHDFDLAEGSSKK